MTHYLLTIRCTLVAGCTQMLTHPKRHRTFSFVAVASLAILLFPFGLLTSPTSASDLRYSPIVKAVQQASPAVVNIHGRKTVRNRSIGRTPSTPERQVNGMGTGIIVDDRGYILTNFHVVQGVSSIVVTQHDKTTHLAKLLAHDQSTDLAIIKIDVERKLPTITTGNSAELMPGETVIAVGNAYGYQHTVTRGIVSAINRNVQVNETQRYENLIQTDASINPGNSGGPLLNIDGEMIGVNVAVRIGAQGIGFAIPANDALEIAAELLAQSPRRRRIGLLGNTTYTEGTSRYVVRRVLPDSPASSHGLQAGDVILEVGGIPVANDLDYERGLLGHTGSDHVNIRYTRGVDHMTASLPFRTGPAAPAWTSLGVRLATVPRSSLGTHQKRYRGGLKIQAVRSGSLAERNGLRPSDVLLGIHKWETVTVENLRYILDSKEYAEGPALKFYLLRNDQVLFGHLSRQESR